jgi:hypothetical protein
MNDLPQIDLSGEMGLVFQDYFVVALVIVVALAFLFRGIWRRRRVSQVCDACPGCGSGGPCSLPDLGLAQPSTNEAAEPREATTGH